MRQLVLDREMLRRMRAAASESRNHVEVFFCECLLTAVRELLPDDAEPTGADLRATVIVSAVEAQEVQDVTPEEELLAVLGQLVEALKVSILELSGRNETHSLSGSEAAPVHDCLNIYPESCFGYSPGQCSTDRRI